MNEVYVHYLSGGPFDGDHIPNKRPWINLILTKPCEIHKQYHNLEEEDCPNCKKYKYVTVDKGFKEADCPSLEVITPDGVDESPITHRIDMNYEGPV